MKNHYDQLNKWHNVSNYNRDNDKTLEFINSSTLTNDINNFFSIFIKCICVMFILCIIGIILYYVLFVISIYIFSCIFQSLFN